MKWILLHDHIVTRLRIHLSEIYSSLNLLAILAVRQGKFTHGSRKKKNKKPLYFICLIIDSENQKRMSFFSIIQFRNVKTYCSLIFFCVIS